MTTQPTQESIALRIRRIRKDHGWSLADVQKLSKGHFKAVVLGSYERGDRSMSLQRAIDLAALYQVPLHYLIQDEELPFRTLRNALILDLRRVRSHSAVDEKSRLLATFAEWISHQRNDWNGEVMTLRAGDLSLLGLLLFSSEVAVEEWLVEKKLLFTAKGQS
ncbi:MAG: helix-turn-helix domain-containing protein [Candidatus Nanopelagicaceae bacterium]|nr:helix-turn-helix domain-containing protein [Candidatus Nanopelagicaceae bacterium]